MQLDAKTIQLWDASVPWIPHFSSPKGCLEAPMCRWFRWAQRREPQRRSGEMTWCTLPQQECSLHVHLWLWKQTSRGMLNSIGRFHPFLDFYGRSSECTTLFVVCMFAATQHSSSLENATYEGFVQSSGQILTISKKVTCEIPEICFQDNMQLSKVPPKIPQHTPQLSHATRR